MGPPRVPITASIMKICIFIELKIQQRLGRLAKRDFQHLIRLVATLTARYFSASAGKSRLSDEVYVTL